MKTCIVTVYSKKDTPFNAVYIDGDLKTILFSNEFEISSVAKLYSEVKMIRVSLTTYKNKKKLAEMMG